MFQRAARSADGAKKMGGAPENLRIDRPQCSFEKTLEVNAF
jgi:hypothetical protein